MVSRKRMPGSRCKTDRRIIRSQPFIGQGRQSFTRAANECQPDLSIARSAHRCAFIPRCGCLEHVCARADSPGDRSSSSDWNRQRISDRGAIHTSEGPVWRHSEDLATGWSVIACDYAWLPAQQQDRWLTVFDEHRTPDRRCRLAAIAGLPAFPKTCQRLLVSDRHPENARCRHWN